MARWEFAIRIANCKWFSLATRRSQHRVSAVCQRFNHKSCDSGFSSCISWQGLERNCCDFQQSLICNLEHLARHSRRIRLGSVNSAAIPCCRHAKVTSRNSGVERERSHVLIRWQVRPAGCASTHAVSWDMQCWNGDGIAGGPCL